MNQTYNRDIKYTFLKRCVKPIQTNMIDDDWIKEKNIEMEIMIPMKNLDVIDENIFKVSNDILNWNDVGMDELLGKNLSQNDLNINNIK